MNVAPSYVTDNGGKTGGKAGGDVPSLSQVWSPVGRSTVEEDGKKPPPEIRVRRNTNCSGSGRE